jgi:hypothetical protein
VKITVKTKRNGAAIMKYIIFAISLSSINEGNNGKAMNAKIILAITADRSMAANIFIYISFCLIPRGLL